MKRIGNRTALAMVAASIAALAFVWYHQAKVVTMPQLHAQFIVLRGAAIGLLIVIGVVVASGPRWMAIPFAVMLTYCFTMPLFRFAGRSPFAWALPYVAFVPASTGENVTGTMKLEHLVLWHRFGLAAIVAVVAAAALLVLNDMIVKRSQQSHGKATSKSAPDGAASEASHA